MTSSQVEIEPLNGHLQIDGDMVKAHAEVVGQLAEELQVQITGQVLALQFSYFFLCLFLLFVDDVDRGTSSCI